jgi:DNA-binding NtrC family response regulator
MASFRNPNRRDVPSDLAGLSILVVEDNFLVGRELGEALRDAGCRVHGPYATGKDATACLRRSGHEIDGAVLNVNLQGEDATGIARMLDERGIPFLVVTGYEYDQLSPALRSGAYVAKPVSVTGLLEMANARFAHHSVQGERSIASAKTNATHNQKGGNSSGRL